MQCMLSRRYPRKGAGEGTDSSADEAKLLAASSRPLLSFAVGRLCPLPIIAELRRSQREFEAPAIVVG